MKDGVGCNSGVLCNSTAPKFYANEALGSGVGGAEVEGETTHGVKSYTYMVIVITRRMRISTHFFSFYLARPPAPLHPRLPRNFSWGGGVEDVKRKPRGTREEEAGCPTWFSPHVVRFTLSKQAGLKATEGPRFERSSNAERTSLCGRYHSRKRSSSSSILSYLLARVPRHKRKKNGDNHKGVNSCRGRNVL